MTRTCQQLPTELWLEVFEWVFAPNSPITKYSPFQTMQACYRDFLLPNAEIGRTLALVCRRWRSWTITLFYRDIRVEHAAYVLKQLLEKSSTQRDYSTWIRRVVLPYSSTATGPGLPTTSVDILKLCTQLETLVRPPPKVTDALLFDFEAKSVSIPTLRRLEWWHNDAAERTGGVNSLSAVLRGSPNLEYLFLCGNSDYSRLRMECRQIELPALCTLRLHTIGGLLLHQITSTWVMPELSHVILDSPIAEHGLDTLWETFGPQLHTVEFGKHLRFLLNDNMPSCLKQCPNLSEFNYYLFFTCIPNITEPHKSVMNIGLHGTVNSFLDERVAWEHIERHFAILTGDAFPTLQTITLHGNWEGILCHPEFPALRQRIYDCGRVLQVSN